MGQISYNKLTEKIDDMAEYEVIIRSIKRSIEEAESLLESTKKEIDKNKNNPDKLELFESTYEGIKERKKDLEKKLKSATDVKNKAEEQLNIDISNGVPETVRELAIKTLIGKSKVLEEINEVKKKKMEENPDDGLLKLLYDKEVQDNISKIETFDAYIEYLSGLQITDKSGLGGY